MAKRSGPPPIVYILIFLILAGVGYWFFAKQSAEEIQGNAPTPLAPAPPPPPPPPDALVFTPPASVPAGTAVSIDGSTAMVTINQNLKSGFEAKFPGTTVNTQATGSDKGIEAVLNGQANIAAVSRPLTPQEQNQGLVAVPVALDQIAVVVSADNPYRRGLTSDQVRGIFTGQITNWSAVGGPDAPIRVLNRPPVSGTHQVFQELALGGQNFGNTPNITTLPRDETTGMLRQLNQDGIGYATDAQVANQQTVRVVPIDGLTPEAADYPYRRQLSYVYQTPVTPEIQAFLGYVTSPEGQQALSESN
ncbi:MAG: phosphate ABC transporter substrate-binding protein [Limnospira sp.]